MVLLFDRRSRLLVYLRDDNLIFPFPIIGIFLEDIWKKGRRLSKLWFEK